MAAGSSACSMKWNSRRRHRETYTEVTEADPERSFVITAQTRSGSRTGCRAEATSQLSASRRYMSRKPQGESEKPQGPATTTAGALGYKGAPTLKNGGWGTRKSKSRSLARTPSRAGARAGVPLTRDDNGVGATRSGTGRRYIDRTRAHARGPASSAGALSYKRRKAGLRWWIQQGCTKVQ